MGWGRQVTVNIIRDHYWAEDIVNELVGLYFMDSLRAQTAADYGVACKWEELCEVLCDVSTGGTPVVPARSVPPALRGQHD